MKKRVGGTGTRGLQNPAVKVLCVMHWSLSILSLRKQICFLVVLRTENCVFSSPSTSSLGCLGLDSMGTEALVT